MQTKLRRNSWLRRRLRAEDAFEAFAVLHEDQVKRKHVVELRSKQCQGKWHEKAEEQQPPTKDLHGEKECSKVRCDDGAKKL